MKKKKRNTRKILVSVDTDEMDDVKRLTGSDNQTEIVNTALAEYKRKLLRENLLKLQGKIRKAPIPPVNKKQVQNDQPKTAFYTIMLTDGKDSFRNHKGPIDSDELEKVRGEFLAENQECGSCKMDSKCHVMISTENENVLEKLCTVKFHRHFKPEWKIKDVK